MYALLLIIHVIVCIFLIMVILLQAGRGSGLGEGFGGSSTQTILGTRTPVFLARATTVCAILFLITCIALGILTSKRGRSLIDMRRGEEKALDTEKVPQLPTVPQETE